MVDKIKLAMVTPWHVRCGIASYSEKLANALAQQDVDVYIIRLPRFGEKKPELLQMLVDTIPAKEVDCIHIEHEYGLYQGLEVDFYKALMQLKKPIVTTMHATIGNREIDSIIAYASKRVIVHNKFCYNRFKTPTTVIIPHGANPAECPPIDECKKTLGIPPEAPIVGYCGFISNYKGLENLITAMTKIPNAALLIAGGWHTGMDTEYIVKLKQISLEVLKGRCQWLGWIPDEKLPVTYGAMDIVVYPSIYSTESGALLMALSHGKAVLATSIAPFREKEGVGALMTFKDEFELVKKIKLLLKDKKATMKLEQGAKKYIESVTWEKVATKHIELYGDAIKK